MQSRPSFLRFAFPLAVLLALGSAAGAQAPLTVRIGTEAVDSGAQAFYAQDKGFFQRAGLTAQVNVINSAAMASAVIGGAIDIGSLSVASLAAARQHDAPFVMIAAASIYSSKLPDTAGIVVAKSSPIKTARDLDGKTVAIGSLHNIAQVAISTFVDRNGGDSNSVKFIEVPSSAMVEAVESGRVDAAHLSEPALAAALAHGDRSLTSGYEAIADEFAIGAWFCTIDYAKAHPDIIHRFASAMAESARWANTHQSESRDILAKWAKVSLPPTLPRVQYGDRLNAGLVQPIIDALAKYQALKESMPASTLLVPSGP